MKQLELSRRRQQNYLEALDRMRYKPRSRSSVETIDRLIVRVQAARVVGKPCAPQGGN